MNRAVKILIAGVAINLCMGVLYAWSVFSKALVSEMGWSNADAGLPYTVAIVVFAASLLVSGILQDRMGPRRMVILGSTMVGLGLIASSFATSVVALVLTFGVLVGSGIGFAYACLTPAAMKWFHSSKKGLVSGLIAGGFGMAPLYLAPTTTALISEFGINNAFLALGVGVLLLALPLSFTIVNPPAGYTPATPKGFVANNKGSDAVDFSWREMIKTKQFYMLWAMFALASSAGLMLIGNIVSIAAVQGGIANAAFLVGALAIFNTFGRIGMGMLSDKIGRIQTLLVVFLLQGLNMVLFPMYTTELGFMLGAALAGVGYGALLSVFPTITADYYGLKNYGTNFGVLYTAWGISGFMGPVLANLVVDATGSYAIAYTASAVGLGIAAVLALMIKPVNAQAEGETGKVATA
ncbi:L-lactate MFS transporter [Ferrimonas marina]|uniref:Nitrate/nitrite transporter NarK n=1 Tax=Ferrimonas marina TaxID=299255 RepID=A0A1M5SES0_9GAMM|nr:OFA family MFS transporter [Ferrimonas marina]SHH37102.1 Nitrate/nitrite transporter NarK [Ferrimonas marina]